MTDDLRRSNESQKPLDFGLRTRITQTIMDSCHGVFVDDAVNAADAVIAELRLEREDGECGYCHAQLPGCRYVTEWDTEE